MTARRSPTCDTGNMPELDHTYVGCPGRGSNTRSLSTTSSSDQVILEQPARAPAKQSVRRAGLPSLSPRDPRKRLSLVVSYKGGPEGWWLVEARGQHWLFPLCTPIGEALQKLSRGKSGHS